MSQIRSVTAVLANTVIEAATSYVMDISRADSHASIQVNATVNSTAKTFNGATQVSTTTGVITSTAHGFFTGLKVQLTTAGTLPTGFSLATNYYIVVDTVDTFQLFDTLTHALAATLDSSGYSTATGVVIPTAVGSGTATVTPVSISGVSYKLQKSNDFVDGVGVSVNHGGTALNAGNWVDVVSGETLSAATQTITTTGSNMVSINNSSYQALRILFAISAGSVAIKVIGNS